MRKILFFSLIILYAANALAQNPKLDSLWIEFYKANHDSVRCDIYLEIGDLFEYQNPDTAIYYYEKGLKLAERKKLMKQHAKSLRYLGLLQLNQSNYKKSIEFFQTSLRISEGIDDNNGIVKCYINIGVLHWYTGEYEMSIDYFSQSIKIAESLNDKFLIARGYNNIGLVYTDQGNYKKAIEYYLNALQLFEEINEKIGITSCLSNIGNILVYQGNYDQALDFYNKSLKIAEEESDYVGLSTSYTTIGIVHKHLGASASNQHVKDEHFRKALECYSKSLSISNDLGDKKGIAGIFNNIASLYYDWGNIEKATEYFIKSINILQEIGDKYGVSISLGNFASLYIALADSVAKTDNERIKYLHKSIDYGIRSMNLAREINSLSAEKDAVATLLKTHKRLGNFQKALEYADIYISLNDSLFSEEKTKAITEMQTKYETEKKQQEIEKQQLTIEKQEIDNKRQRNLRNFFIAGSVLLALLALVVFRGYRQKKRSNTIITEKNAQLEQANEEISAQRDTVTQQKEHIEHIHGELTSSIRYAQRIQEAVLPSPEQMAELLGDHFVLFKPKDIVSGDFYWATKVKTNPQPFLGGRELGSGIEEGERVYGYNTADPMLYKLLKDKAEEMRREPTEAEAILWKYLKANQTGYHFRRQHIIDRFIVDFVCLKRGLVVEVDGEIHGFTVEEDSLRTEILKLRGYKVIRFKNQEVIADSEKVVNKIKEEISKLPEHSSGAKQEEEQVLHPGEDLGVALKVLPPGEGLGGTLKVLPPGEDLGGALKVLPPGEDLGGALKVLPPGEDLGGALKVLPPGEDLGGVLKVLPPGEDLGGAELLIFCVADCTGHGVPGAFMSMLGVSFLNEIVHKEHVTSAAEVLNHLRDSIIAALKQRGESSEQKDGMDMGLCVINTETRQMQFAGGYNPCWVIPNAEHPNERLLDPKPDQEAAEGLPVIQLKPDKMPIAIHKHMEPYTNHLLQLFPGDQIYLMSDGFQDQFGGEHSKKFMVKNLRELVVANANLPMEQQRKALERALEDWKGRMEQVDDVTILGIRI